MDHGQIGAEMPSGNQLNSKKMLLACLGIGALFFTLHDLIGLLNGGGIFSFTSAIRATRAHVPSVDVDGASLRTLFIFGCTFVSTMAAALLKADFDKKLTQFLFLALLIGGGFTLDALYGPEIIQTVMAHHGYSRCAARDHTIGSGKGRVWLDNYVSNETQCDTRNPQ